MEQFQKSGFGGGADSSPSIDFPDPEGPTLDEFINDEDIKQAYLDPELHAILDEIEKDPSAIERHYKNEKIQTVIQLIEKKFKKYMPDFLQTNNPANVTQEALATMLSQGGDMQNLQAMLSQGGGMQNQAAMLGQSGGMQNLAAMLGQSGGMQNLAAMLGQGGARNRLRSGNQDEIEKLLQNFKKDGKH